MEKTLLTVVAIAFFQLCPVTARDFPQPTDSQTEVIPFAGSDLIKQPIGLTFTLDGKLLVVESHTHHRPESYDGPESDQIVWLRDTDGDGVADKRSVVFGNNLRATMNIATHPQTGAIYVATNRGIIRLWDQNENGVADLWSAEQVIFFKFEHKYQDHGYGCAGLAFDDEGNLLFGIGGLLGAPYTLNDREGRTFSDQGEGGNIWRCTMDGKKLERFATGFWNPFGLCYSPDGDVFVTDNDPSSRPPSRLHHVIEGGDYGYQFRYGASGQHPFISWDGELPGTLPMLHGTGDAPCDVLFHKGNLLVASWCDHRIEVYPLKWNQTHFATERRTMVKGGLDFRPVGMAIGDDGDLYVTDWVKGDYQLHGEGAIWRLKNWETADCDATIDDDLAKTGGPEDPWAFSKMISRDRPEGDMSPERRRIFDLLAARFHEKSEGDDLIRDALKEDQPSETLRLLALKWIADQQLERFRPAVLGEIQDPVSPRIFHAAITAKARIDGLTVMDQDLEKLLMAELDSESELARRAAFLLLDDRGKVPVDRLRKIYGSGDEEMRAGVALTLRKHGDPEAAKAFAREIRESDPSLKIRAFAGLALPDLPETRPEDSLELGEYLFHKNCAICHRVNGFGKKGALDLSRIGIRGQEHIVRSIREPSAEISPQYETWKVTMADGKQHIGFIVGEQSGRHFYSDASGTNFEIDANLIAERENLLISLMPPRLDEKIGPEDFPHLLDWLLQLK